MRIGRHEAELDLYKILGVSSLATQAEIRRAHRRLVRAHHPDLLGGAGDPACTEQTMKAINHAASILSDPHARASYDALRAGRRPPPRPSAPPPPAWYDAPVSVPADPAPEAPCWFDRVLERMAPSPREDRGDAVRRVIGFAAVATLLCFFAARLVGGPTIVASPDYKLPKGPERVTMWAE